MIKAVLFDLDGTLLPMDLQAFLHSYFSEIGRLAAVNGHDPELFMKALNSGTKAMLINDGSESNEQAFWKGFTKKLGSCDESIPQLFMSYYLGSYLDSVNKSCQKSDAMVDSVKVLNAKGYPLAIATNPLFPIEAVQVRLNVAGLKMEDFDLITTYDNCCFSKPKAEYFLNAAHELNVEPRDCLMVGNDTADDMPAAQCGMQTYLVTDCLINDEKLELSGFQHGTATQFFDFVNKLPAIE